MSDISEAARDFLGHKEADGILAICALNKIKKRIEWKRELRIGRFRCVVSWRSSRNLWGRFGGGWDWKFGFCAGGRTLIIDLLVFSVRLEMCNAKR